MGAQKGRKDLQGTIFVKLEQDLKQFELVFKAQAVAGFGFSAGGAHREYDGCPLTGLS